MVTTFARSYHKDHLERSCGTPEDRSVLYSRQAAQTPTPPRGFNANLTFRTTYNEKHCGPRPTSAPQGCRERRAPKDDGPVDFTEVLRDNADSGRAATALGRVEGWTAARGMPGGRGGGYLGNCTGKAVDTTVKNADQWRTTYKAMLLPGYHQPGSARPMASPAKSVPRTRLDVPSKYAVYGAPSSARTPRRRGAW